MLVVTGLELEVNGENCASKDISGVANRGGQRGVLLLANPSDPNQINMEENALIISR